MRLATHIRHEYGMIDVNVYHENLFHTKMILETFDLDTYMFRKRSTNQAVRFTDRVPRVLCKIADLPVYVTGLIFQDDVLCGDRTMVASAVIANGDGPALRPGSVGLQS